MPLMPRHASKSVVYSAAERVHMPASLAAPPRPPYTKRRTRSSPSSSSSSLHAALLSQAWRDLTVIRSSHASNSSSSSKEESSSATVLNNDPEEEAEWDRLALAAENLIAQQQQQQHQSSGDLPLSLAQPSLVTLRMVETAMLAAVAGLAYTVATLLKLEGYLAYVMPLPVVVACLRNGAGAGVKTTAVAFLLLFILMGPIKALTYLLIYGVLSLALGACWAVRLPWAVSIPLAACARIAGYGGYLGLSSWMTNENLLALMITNVHALLDQTSALLGTSGAPSAVAVSVVLASMLFVNSLFYVFLMHWLYAIILKGMGLKMGPLPGFTKRFMPPGVV